MYQALDAKLLQLTAIMFGMYLQIRRDHPDLLHQKLLISLIKPFPDLIRNPCFERP